MKKLLLLTILQLNLFLIEGQTLLPAGSTWKYNDSGLDLGSSWKDPSYNDNSWASGLAELGYGDGDEQTVVSYGPNSNNKYITTYFRKVFYISNPSQYQEILGSIRRDDGAIVYVNGTEVFRTNMPGGAITYQTAAASTVAFTSEDTYYNFAFSPGLLISGNNVIAVEIHQDEGSSSDISFNLSLNGSQNPQVIQVTREPYLNTGTSHSMIVRWQTDIPCDSKVRYGTNPNNLNLSASVFPYTTEHAVQITGLLPKTRYYYSIGTTSHELIPSGNNQYFKTSPIEGSREKYRFWAIGDAGMSDGNQRAVRDGYLIYNENRHVDGWIMLGDNAYGSGISDGTQSCYQTAVFSQMYADLISKTVCWPALGNHDYNNHIPFSPAPAYFDIFNLPTNGEAGGVASGTEKYYSYNYGNIHFIVLDSYDEDRSVTAPMASWLVSDLQQTTAEWIVAYWHHPPYTKGSHDSDNPMFLDGECEDMRENILPILEQYGVDLVLNGHSHSYERSYLVDSHYGTSGTLTQQMLKDDGSGGRLDDCPYEKETLYSKAHQGTVYAVVGCSGKLSSVASGWPHPVCSYADHDNMGSLSLTIQENRLDAQFVSTTGSVLDQFSIIKNAGISHHLTACQNELVNLKPSFPGKVLWQPNQVLADSLSVLVTHTTMYLASDTNGCIVDTFYVELVNTPACNGTAGITDLTVASPKVWTNAWLDEQYIPIQWSGFNGNELDIEIWSVQGQLIYSKTVPNDSNKLLLVEAAKFLSGTYLLRASDLENTLFLKFLH
ncbi:purple acid phosphatase family protein [Fluviicola chungangensis]|uniref:Metallophosphoesterase family protein n=1 Tax=Fluviicola chungangensis TaxID=2597671 RepID=A0A556N3S6_9FLAO|nr:metallophosphoesterase family protein [Fluviicola chungangensis]TSJ46771.1 metallophosphoesterase family protein [Fluviicola chungangensis]